MRIHSLDIQNFRVLKNAQLTFPDQVIGIVGRNGAGKSSLIEAIAWALYGNQAARTGKDEIKSTFAKPADICEVKVKFSINDDTYTVIRRLSGKSDRAEVELYRGESSESVGVNETKNYVGQLLGLDWRGFLSSFLARQSELNALSDLPPAKRRDHIAGMLGIERLDKAISNLKEDTKQYKEKVLFLQKHLLDKDTLEKTILELTENINKLHPPLKEKKQSAKEKESDFKAAQSDFELFTKKRIEFLHLKGELSAQTETRTQLLNQKEKLQTEQNRLAETEKELSRLQAQKDSFSQLESQLELQTEAKNKLELSRNLTQQLRALSKKKEEHRLRQTTISSDLLNIQNQLKELPDDLAASLKQAKLDLEEKRTAYSQTKAALDQLQKEQQKTVRQLTQISEFKADSVCERCRRPFGDDYLSIRQHIEFDQKKIAAEIQQKEKELSALKHDGSELKIKTEKLEQNEKLTFTLRTKLESQKEELKNITTSLNEITASESDITNQLNKIGNIQFDDSRYQQLLTQKEQLNKINEAIHTARGSLDRKETIVKELNENLIQQKEIASAIDSQEKKLSQIGYTDNLFEQKTEKFNQTRDSYEQAKNDLLALTREFELTERSLQEKLEQKKQFEKSEEEFEKTKSAQFYGEKLTTLFTAYRQNLIASIRPSLADSASQLFDEMTDHKYNLVELDEKYDLRVMDNGIYYGVERFSGGEKDLANLCLRLAISMALTKSAGLDRSFIILDEVFGSQDNERKELILKALANLKNRFPQIFLITHVDDIKDGVEQVLEVIANESGYSEVFIHES